jgi:hypothetical protein
MNSNTVLAIVFLIAGALLTITLLTITAMTTMVSSAYADNKQKAEDDSAAAIADCDENEVEEARFLCIAIAANDVEIETEPPEESATLSVCKELGDPTLEPDDFTFTFEEGNNPSPSQFQGDNADGCVDVTIGPGEYTVTEAAAFTNFATRIQEGSDCVQDPIDLFSRRATGEIQAGETQECVFFNFRD